jgi:hypothetical protein
MSGNTKRCGCGRIFFVFFLAAAMATGSWGATPAGITLAVNTDPEGATIYIDDGEQGQTPLTLTDLEPGLHNIRVVKKGYIARERNIDLKAGQTASIEFAMTPLTHAEPPSPTSRPLPQAQPQKKGVNKLLIGGIALGAVALGTGVMLATKNSPPVAGTIGVTPSGKGMAGMTEYVFSATGASDPDKDSLTYAWEFGDGGTSAEQAPRHVYETAGTYAITLTVSDGKKKASTTATVTVGKNMTGTWIGNLIGATTTVTMTQSGTSLSGNFNLAGVLSGAVRGSISGAGFPYNVTLTVAISGYEPFTFNGTLTDENNLRGVVNGSGFVNDAWNLSRQ